MCSYKNNHVVVVISMPHGKSSDPNSKDTTLFWNFTELSLACEEWSSPSIPRSFAVTLWLWYIWKESIELSVSFSAYKVHKRHLSLVNIPVCWNWQRFTELSKCSLIILVGSHFTTWSITTNSNLHLSAEFETPHKEETVSFNTLYTCPRQIIEFAHLCFWRKAFSKGSY